MANAHAVPNLRERFSLLVRETILEKAAELFARQGYGETSVRAIAAAAGTTHTTFYKHFEGKLELVLELGQGSTRDVERAYEDLRSIAPTDRAAMRGWVDRIHAIWRERRGPFEASWEAAYADPASLHAVYDLARGNAATYRAGREGAAAVLDDPLTHELAMTVVGLSPMFSILLREEDAEVREAMLEGITSTLMRALSREGGWDPQ